MTAALPAPTRGEKNERLRERKRGEKDIQREGVNERGEDEVWGCLLCSEEVRAARRSYTVVALGGKAQEVGGESSPRGGVNR